MKTNQIKNKHISILVLFALSLLLTQPVFGELKLKVGATAGFNFSGIVEENVLLY